MMRENVMLLILFLIVATFQHLPTARKDGDRGSSSGHYGGIVSAYRPTVVVSSSSSTTLLARATTMMMRRRRKVITDEDDGRMNKRTMTSSLWLSSLKLSYDPLTTLWMESDCSGGGGQIRNRRRRRVMQDRRSSRTAITATSSSESESNSDNDRNSDRDSDRESDSDSKSNNGRVPLVLPCDTSIPILYPIPCCKTTTTTTSSTIDREQQQLEQQQEREKIKQSLQSVKQELLDILTPSNGNRNTTIKGTSEHWQQLTHTQHIHIHALILALQSLQHQLQRQQKQGSHALHQIQTMDFLIDFVLTGTWKKVYTNVKLAPSSSSLVLPEYRGKFVFNVTQHLSRNEGRSKPQDNVELSIERLLKMNEIVSFQYEDLHDASPSSLSSSTVKGKLIIDSLIKVTSDGKQDIQVQEYALMPEEENNNNHNIEINDSFVQQLQTVIPFDSFDPDQCISEVLYADGDLRINKLTGPYFKNLLNVFIRQL